MCLACLWCSAKHFVCTTLAFHWCALCPRDTSLVRKRVAMDASTDYAVLEEHVDGSQSASFEDGNWLAHENQRVVMSHDLCFATYHDKCGDSWFQNTEKQCWKPPAIIAGDWQVRSGSLPCQSRKLRAFAFRSFGVCLVFRPLRSASPWRAAYHHQFELAKGPTQLSHVLKSHLCHPGSFL